MEIPEVYITTTIRLFAALAAGGLIGLERSYNGRPAGFRTHSLVCLSSSLLMLLTVYQWQLLDNAHLDTIRVDPTRMAQGIMTGIGFLGAGVIMKEQFTIRGLTTAASIWVTASIGILIGMGFYFPAILACVMSLGTLSLFRYFEARLPTLRSARLKVSSLRKSNLTEDDLLEVVQYYDIQASGRTYHLEDEGRFFTYEMTIFTREPANFRTLAETLIQMKEIHAFRLIQRTT